MGPAIDSRIKPPDVGIPMLHTEFEVKEAEHNSHHLNNVMTLSYPMQQLEQPFTISTPPQHTNIDIFV